MRQCGDCQICCKLLPIKAGSDADADHPETRKLLGYPPTIPNFDKPAGKRCPHQRHGKGCAVYDTRPLGCRAWNCRWLVNDDTADLSRPDRSHYVIDMVPDFVRIDAHDGNEPTPVPVVQIWLDPDYPEAYRDPALLAFIERRAKDGMLALIRFNERDAFTLFAPSWTPDGQWHEVHHGTRVKERGCWPGGKMEPVE